MGGKTGTRRLITNEDLMRLVQLNAEVHRLKRERAEILARNGYANPKRLPAAVSQALKDYG